MFFVAGSKTITGTTIEEDDDLTTNEDLLEQDESMMTTEDETTAEDQKPVVSFLIRILQIRGKNFSEVTFYFNDISWGFCLIVVHLKFYITRSLPWRISRLGFRISSIA